MSQDPLGYEGGDTNLYRYCGNSVTNTVDPSGLDPAPHPPTPKVPGSHERIKIYPIPLVGGALSVVSAAEANVSNEFYEEQADILRELLRCWVMLGNSTIRPSAILTLSSRRSRATKAPGAENTKLPELRVHWRSDRGQGRDAGRTCGRPERNNSAMSTTAVLSQWWNGTPKHWSKKPWNSAPALYLPSNARLARAVRKSGNSRVRSTDHSASPRGADANRRFIPVTKKLPRSHAPVLSDGA